MPGQYTASLPVPASCLSPGVLHAGQQGCSWVVLGECRCRFPWEGGQLLRSAWQSLGPAISDPASPLGLGGILCCIQGHIQWNLKWHPAWQLITVHAGCFVLMVWGGILCGREIHLGSWLIPFLYLACIEQYSHILAHRGACVEDREATWMAFAQSFPVAYGHFVWSHACHIGMCGTSWGWSTLTDTLSQC